MSQGVKAITPNRVYTAVDELAVDALVEQINKQLVLAGKHTELGVQLSIGQPAVDDNRVLRAALARFHDAGWIVKLRSEQQGDCYLDFEPMSPPSQGKD